MTWLSCWINCSCARESARCYSPKSHPHRQPQRARSCQTCPRLHLLPSQGWDSPLHQHPAPQLRWAADQTHQRFVGVPQPTARMRQSPGLHLQNWNRQEGPPWWLSGKESARQRRSLRNTKSW